VKGASSPPEVDVFFSEPVDVKYSKLKILDETGKQVETAGLHHVKGDCHDNAAQTSGEGANAGGTVKDPTIT
jgi:methionine-rich copper-binding protein CopC